ncbi:glycosyltransferase [Rubellicoccus peritrichatus]|uniref:Glycosyltransferase n=1 Tax=Rubellicoccus peritrichatus TaxID=3080537 RepID=A0AAQ3L844_9BACT|nr:glycosyltransferase [Puniceicoccus sp. CR14]WOO40821.1 glycosyltransferase [Puniceicoccus sp. CR14]
MKICFICGSIAPGRDGVGDYTTSLATVLTQNDRESCVISLTERTTGKDDFPFAHLRLTADLDWKEKSSLVKEFLATEKPDVISLQYVPYAFDPKGLPKGFNHWLKENIGPVDFHIMFHELWVAAEHGASFKSRILGTLQKRMISKMLSSLNPISVHTTNRVYKQLLKGIGIDANTLSLFSSIDPSKDNVDAFTMFEKAGIELSNVNRKGWLLAGVFGTIHPTWNIERAFELLASATQSSGKKAVFVLIGRNGTAAEAGISKAQEQYPTVTVARLGALSDAEFNAAVSNLDFAFSASPWALLGKSASASALLGQRCPLVFTDDRWRLSKGTTPLPELKTGLYLDEPELEEKIVQGLEKPALPPTVETIAEQMYRDIEKGHQEK